MVQSQTELECRGTLTVGGRNLACTHPRELRSFAAEQALAYSCNAYFAAVAQRMDFAAVAGAMEAVGLRPSLRSGGPDAKVLLALGLAGISVTPQQLAQAYRQLALQMSAEVATPPVRLVERGMLGSVEYGMSHNCGDGGCGARREDGHGE